ncbi:uncharacterized protein J3D65DRAFT_20770 [Phyllosticta citribraziliensis]|uniref:Uncharacterized protein n=1 Tax=Phyllosticta citribraziliensis TaxID=989973 RepID=A0ABR1M9B3_9PEZI
MSLVWPAPIVYNLPPAFVTNIKQALIMEQKAQELRSKRLTHSPVRYILKAAIQPFKILSSIRLHSFAVTRLLPVTHPSTMDIGKFKSQVMQLCHKSAGHLLSMLKLEALRPFKEFHLNISTNATLNWSIPSAVQHHIFETAQDYYQQATLSAIRTLRNASSARVYKTPSSLLPQLPNLYEMNARTCAASPKARPKTFSGACVYGLRCHSPTQQPRMRPGYWSFVATGSGTDLRASTEYSAVPAPNVFFHSTALDGKSTGSSKGSRE